MSDSDSTSEFSADDLLTDLEEEWDDAEADDLEDDPELLVAEVEEFLRDVD